MSFNELVKYKRAEPSALAGTSRQRTCQVLLVNNQKHVVYLLEFLHNRASVHNFGQPENRGLEICTTRRL